MSTNNQTIDYTKKHRIKSARVSFAHYVKNRKDLDNMETVNSVIYPSDNDASIVTLLNEGRVSTTVDEYNEYVKEDKEEIDDLQDIIEVQPEIPPVETQPTPTPYMTAVSRNAEAFLFFPQISSVSNYQYSLDGGSTILTFSPAQTISPIRVTGLVNLIKYTILLRPIIGGVAGAFLPPAIVTPGVPNPPTNLLVTPGDGQLSISFTVIGNGGSNITNYQYSVNNGPFQSFTPAQIAIPITITGLTNGTSYSIRLKAVNIRGASDESEVVVGKPSTAQLSSSFVNYYTGTYDQSLNQTSLLRAFNAGGSSASQLPYTFSAANRSIFILKQNYNGVCEWMARVQGSGTTSSGATTNFVTKDKSGNAYIHGFYNSQITVYNSGPNNSIFATLPRSTNATDNVVIKYNSLGLVQWIVRVAGLTNGTNSQIVTDDLENVYFVVCSSSSITVMYANGTSQTITSPNTMTINSYLIKLNKNGVGDSMIRVTNGYIRYLICDSDGNLYVGGRTGSGAQIISKNGSTQNIALSGSTTGLLAKINSMGILQWFIRLTTSSTAEVKGIQLDKLKINIFLVGDYTGGALTVNNAGGGTLSYTLPYISSFFGNFHTNSFLLKINSNGIAQWGVRFNHSTTFSIYRCIVDSEDSCYVTGIYQVSGSTPLSVFNAGNGSSSLSYGLPMTGFNNSAIIKYNTNGIAQWASHFSAESFGNSQPTNLVLDENDNVYLTAYTARNLTINYPRNLGSFWYTIPAASGGITVIIKYDKNGLIHWGSRLTGWLSSPD